MTQLVLTDAELPDEMLAMIGQSCRVVVWQGAATAPNLLAEAEGLLTYGHPLIGPAELDRMPKLRIISNFGVGVDHLDLPAASQRRVAVGNTPGFVDHATADMTMALLLAIGRNVVTGNSYAHSPAFTNYNPSILHGHDVHGATLGIVGLGAIGKLVARRANGFEMKVIYHNRKPDLTAEAELGVRYTSLANLLSEADFVALNVPLTPATRNMIGAEQLQQMKSTAFLINMARGAVVDHDALNQALANKLIAGAALDVTEPEPLPRNHPLLERANVIVTPHLGSAARRTRTGMYRRTVDNLLAGLSGQELPSSVA